MTTLARAFRGCLAVFAIGGAYGRSIHAHSQRRTTCDLSRCESTEAVDWKKRLQAANGWEPFSFVDFCEECCRANDAALTRAAEEIQFAEMLLLIERTYRDASE